MLTGIQNEQDRHSVATAIHDRILKAVPLLVDGPRGIELFCWKSFGVFRINNEGMNEVRDLRLELPFDGTALVGEHNTQGYPFTAFDLESFH
jgi:hypothetical protein